MTELGIKQIIQLAKSEKYKVCIWGAGTVGKEYGYQMLARLGIKIDFYCDNNPQFYGKIVKDSIICMNPQSIPDKTICFLMVSGHLNREILMQIQAMKFKFVVTYMQLCEYISRDFFPVQKKNQIAIYTCVVGNYDMVKEPEFIDEKCDYFIISDQKPVQNSIYQYIDIQDVLEEKELDQTRKNRYCKINAHKIFPNYRYSIYFDGNIMLKGSMTRYLSEFPRTRLIALLKTSYNSIYAEAYRTMIHGRDEKDKFIQQMEKYWLEGMPEDFGLVVPAMMVREHNNPMCRRIMEEWWQEVRNYSRRDMISLPYVLWKHGYTIDDVGLLSKEDDMLDGNEWEFQRNHFKPRIQAR